MTLHDINPVDLFDWMRSRRW